MYCIKCGSQLSDEAKFCTNCGANINNESPENTYYQSSSNENNKNTDGERTLITKAPTNLFCILGICISVISFFINLWGLVAIVGVVLSIIGLQQIKTTQENGRELAISGIIGGGINIIYACISIMRYI